MARRRCRSDDDYSDGSNCSDSPDDVSLSDEDEMFDVEVDGADTSLTDIDDQGDDCDDIDVEDQAQLFDGNLQPREYYLKQLQEFNEAAFNEEDYSPGSTILLDGIEELWNRHCAWARVRPTGVYSPI